MDNGKINKDPKNLKDLKNSKDDFMMAYFVDDIRPKQDLRNTENTILKDNFKVFKLIENQRIYI